MNEFTRFANSEERRLQYYLLLLQFDEGVEDAKVELVEVRVPVQLHLQ